jgi:predicted dehydrogenase
MRVGIIGAGMYANVALYGYSRVPEIEVTSICDVVPHLAQSAAEAFGVAHTCTDHRELISREDVDLVHVVVPPPVHHAITLDIVAAGKHVLTEKPLAMSEREAAEMLQAAEQAGVVHAIGHEMRYDPLHRHMRDLIAQGYIGAPRLVKLSDVCNYAADPRYPTFYATWTMRMAQGGGVLLQHAAHILDLAGYLFGPIEIAGGIAANQVPQRPVLAPDVHPAKLFELGADAPTTGEAPVDADDTTILYGTLPGGGLFTFSAGWTVHHPSGVTWEIYGSEGTLKMLSDGSLVGGRSVDPELTVLSAPAKYGLPGEQPWLARTGVLTEALDPMFRLMAVDIAAAVDGRAGDRAFATFADGLVTQRAMDSVARI